MYETALTGTQTLRALPASDGSEVELSLEYELPRYGPLGGVADAIFIRRALRDSLRRTLYRFAIEAEDLLVPPVGGPRTTSRARSCVSSEGSRRG